MPDHRIPGSDDQYNQHGATTPVTQNKNDSGGVSEIAEGRGYLGSCLSTPIGENEHDSMRDSPSSSVLPPLTDGTIQHAREEHSELRFTGEFGDNLSRGAELVGHTNVQMEWEINLQDGGRPDDQLRCILDRLGSLLSLPNDGGPWLAEEAGMHINCLEWLAATLAVKSFTKDQTRTSILLRTDNTTAVAYINH